MSFCRNLRFEPHQIAGQLDQFGRYAVDLKREFPFHVRLFHFKNGKITLSRTWHETLEVFMPLDGPVRVRMGDTAASLKAGDLLVVDNRKLHNVEDQPGLNTRAIVLSFQPEFVYSLGSPPCDYTLLLPFFASMDGNSRVLRATNLAMPVVYRCLKEVLDCYFAQGSEPVRQAGCKANLMLILYHLARNLPRPDLSRTELLRQQEWTRALRSVFEHIEKNYADPTSVLKAARMVHMSESRFSHIFKAVSGTTFVAFLTHVRMSHACRLLRETNLTVAEIAVSTGFHDQSYFDRRFKAAFGVSPRDYRKK